MLQDLENRETVTLLYQRTCFLSGGNSSIAPYRQIVTLYVQADQCTLTALCHDYLKLL